MVMRKYIVTTTTKEQFVLEIDGPYKSTRDTINPIYHDGIIEIVVKNQKDIMVVLTKDNNRDAPRRVTVRATKDDLQNIIDLINDVLENLS